MKKRILTAVVALMLLGLAACGGDSRSGDITFQQVRDNETGVIFTLRESTMQDFEANFGEGVFEEEARLTLGSSTNRVDTRTYSFLDGMVKATFAASDSSIFRVDNGRVMSINIETNIEDATEGRFETYGFAIGATRDEVSNLDGFHFHLVTSGSDNATRRLSSDGGIGAPATPISTTEYYTNIALRGHIVTNMRVSQGLGQ